VNEDCLKITTYFGERDRLGDRFVSDAFTEVYARHQLATSVVMRGVEGFGEMHQMRTDRLLTLSEDLPLVSVAVDTRPRVEAAVADIAGLPFQGLVTLERARMLSDGIKAVGLPSEPHDATTLTVYVGRRDRSKGKPAYEAVVDVLHRHGVAGATVLLGIDGTAHGVRQRARFFGRNGQVPLMVIAVGHADRIAGALAGLGALLPRPLVTLEPVRICKRDGMRLADLDHVPSTDSSGLGIWQKVMVYASEQSRHDGHPLSPQLVRALREAGAAGATSVRGIWGYHGDHPPHGDSFWQLRRRVPVLTIMIDTPERMRRWYAIVDEITAETGLVTSQAVPALQTRGAHNGRGRGGLRLSQAIT
jgi:PII-like signaling protein